MANANFLNAKQNQSQLLVSDYAKSEITQGVVHLGVGAFHRAHQAVYFDRLLALKGHQKWGITGVNIRPNDSEMFATLANQGGEFVLKNMNSHGDTEYHHIRSISHLIDGAKQPFAVDELIADPSTQIISCTVTEGGYYLNELHELILDHPAIAGDLNEERNTLYAFLYQGLKLRSAKGSIPVTLMCCDNLRHNGHLLKSGLMQFLEAKKDVELIAWVKNNTSFPCSMVDRITPKPSQLHIDEVRERFDIEDNMSVMAEDYLQWVIEDNFAGDKPALDLVHAQFVDDVTPYEEAKIRILNAGHTSVTYQAALKNLVTFDQAMQDIELRNYFEDFIIQDAIPAIGKSLIDLPSYYKIIADRFSNAHIGDTVERICTDGYSKFPIFILPTLRGCYELGRIPKSTLVAIASWFVFIQKSREKTISTPYHEPNWSELDPFDATEKGIIAFASEAALWGDLSEKHPEFVNQLSECIHTSCKQYGVTISQ